MRRSCRRRDRVSEELERQGERKPHLAGNDVEGSDAIGDAKGAHGDHEGNQRICLYRAELVEALLRCRAISNGIARGAKGERLTSLTDMCGGW
jgi:hypothetical protein